MLFFKNAFKNYEEFKELFGVQEHGNGEKSRRNKILLSLYKSKDILHMMANQKEVFEKGDFRWLCRKEYPMGVSFYDITSMTSLGFEIMHLLKNESSMRGVYYLDIPLLGSVKSSLFESDDFHGLCEDGDVRSIRYVNVERQRVFKMRAGKFMRKLIEENVRLDQILPEQVKIWFCEDFAERWKAYASNEINDDRYTLFVNDNFEDIYDSGRCRGDFGSCMVNDGYWTFYRDSVKAKAAYLEDKNGDIVARCIIYTEVHDGLGNILRLAERQYSSDGDETLKRLLVMRLIGGGHIDGYKRVGADCHSPKAFVDTDGNALKNCDLWIDCNLRDYDTVSYQDSFKDYEPDECVARNCDSIDNLSITDGVFNRGEWSEYHDEYISENDAYYVETRDDYFYYNEVVSASVMRNGRYYSEYCFEEDCVEIGNNYYYAGHNAEDYEDYGIGRCPECGNYFLEDCGHYSDVTDETYCDYYCLQKAEQRYKEDNWFYSEYDDDYYEDGDEVVTAWKWDFLLHRYVETSIHCDSLKELFEVNEASYFEGRYYLDKVGFDGEPAHIAAAQLHVA